MGDISEHFSTRELACHCCGRISISGELVTALEQLRALGPEPIDISDACRCTKHNEDVGGVGKSEHLFWDASEGKPAKPCEAADLRIVGLTLMQMFTRALSVPAFMNGGIGVYDSNFIHVDVRQGRARWARVNGKYVGITESGLLNAT